MWQDINCPYEMRFVFQVSNLTLRMRTLFWNWWYLYFNYLIQLCPQNWWDLCFNYLIKSCLQNWWDLCLNYLIKSVYRTDEIYASTISSVLKRATYTDAIASKNVWNGPLVCVWHCRCHEAQTWNRKIRENTLQVEWQKRLYFYQTNMIWHKNIL